MKKKIWIIIGFVILLSLFIFLNLWEQKDKSSKAVDVTTLSEKTIDETVIAPGKLIFANKEAIYLEDRKSTRLNSSHVAISYAVFCLKKKNKIKSINTKII